VISSLGEIQAQIPNIRDIDLYHSQTNVEAQSLLKKCKSMIKYLTQATDKSTKVASRNYIERNAGEEAREIQRRRDEINRRKALIDQQREQLRLDQEELARQQAELRPRRAPRR